MQSAESEGSGNSKLGFWEKFKKRIRKYAPHYSDEKFQKKIAKFANMAWKAVLRPALILYYAARDKRTPELARATMFGALGYFISPLDAILDITPAVGYTDDLWVLATATAVVAAHIKEEHIEKAEETLNHFEETLSRWFGQDS